MNLKDIKNQLSDYFEFKNLIKDLSYINFTKKYISIINKNDRRFGRVNGQLVIGNSVQYKSILLTIYNVDNNPIIGSVIEYFDEEKQCIANFTI